MHTTPNSADCLDVADLLVDYAERTLLPEQMARMETHLTNCPRCQERVAQLRQLGGKLEAAETVAPPLVLRTNFMAALAQEKAALANAKAEAGEAKVIRMEPAAATPASGWWMRIAASVVLLAAGILLGNLWRPLSPEVAAVTTADTAATQQRFHALTGNPTAPTLSASDRIQLVSELAGEAEAEASGDPVVQVLINTLNFDPNTNVRLAAGQALFRLREDPRVGEAFIQSLTIQTDPNVQIMLIELLVALRERRAVPQLERLAQRRDALPIVRQQAESGLGLLI